MEIEDMDDDEDRRRQQKSRAPRFSTVETDHLLMEHNVIQTVEIDGERKIVRVPSAVQFNYGEWQENVIDENEPTVVKVGQDLSDLGLDEVSRNAAIDSAGHKSLEMIEIDPSTKCVQRRAVIDLYSGHLRELEIFSKHRDSSSSPISRHESFMGNPNSPCARALSRNGSFRRLSNKSLPVFREEVENAAGL